MCACVCKLNDDNENVKRNEPRIDQAGHQPAGISNVEDFQVFHNTALHSQPRNVEHEYQPESARRKFNVNDVTILILLMQ